MLVQLFFWSSNLPNYYQQRVSTTTYILGKTTIIRVCKSQNLISPWKNSCAHKVILSVLKGVRSSTHNTLLFRINSKAD